MKSSLAHLSPTVLAFGAAIGLSLSLFLLSGVGLQGGAIPLLPALGGEPESVAAKPLVHHRRTAPAATAVSATQPVFVPGTVTAPRPAAPRAHHPVRHARARVRVRARPQVVRPAPTPQAPVAVVAPTTPVTAPQPVRAPRGKAKALGHQRGHFARAPVTGALARGNGQAPAHGNGHARGHSPEHHQRVPPGQAKEARTTPPAAPAAPPKAKGGGPPADHGGGNGNGHKGGKK